jgi:membrane protein YqaA with SNARE-associated domain
MFIDLLQTATRKHSSGFAYFGNLGAFGLFALAMLDSLPFPTFGGPDILTAILAAHHRAPWYEYAAAATAGSVIGAFITFRLARHAGIEYLDKHFGSGRVRRLLKLFEKWGIGALAISTAVPFPTPTSFLFAAAGATKYPLRKFLIVVALCRAARYSLIAILAEHYGRHFVRAVRNPGQYWGWLLLFAVIIAGMAASAIAMNKRLEQTTSTSD